MKGKVGELWNTVFVGILKSMLNGFLPFFFKKRRENNKTQTIN